MMYENKKFLIFEVIFLRNEAVFRDKVFEWFSSQG